MNEEDLQELFDAQERRMRATSTAFHRSLYPEIDWNDRLLCIKGPKGTGKTTMLLQRIKEAFPDLEVLADTKIWHNGARIADCAFEHGADMVTILAGATDQEVEAVVSVAERYGAKVAADMAGGREWILRWESMPNNRDMPFEGPPFPPASELRVIKVR